MGTTDDRQQITPDACRDPQVERARDFVRRARELADDEARFGRLSPAQQTAEAAQRLATDVRGLKWR